MARLALARVASEKIWKDLYCDSFWNYELSFILAIWVYLLAENNFQSIQGDYPLIFRVWRWPHSHIESWIQSVFIIELIAIVILETYQHITS